MRATRSAVSSFALAGLLLSVSAIRAQERVAARPPDFFASVNGLRLHYLDWGGHGEAVLFLPGGGGDVHAFDSFAPKLAAHFHVLGLTRRGQGQSEKPASGYATETLADDIKGFLDVMHIQRVVLIGHSIAGVEMTKFAVLYPTRLAKLIYLDAASDYKRLHDIELEAHLDPPGDFALVAIHNGAIQEHPAFGKISCAALAFYAVWEAVPPSKLDDDPAYKRYLQIAFDQDFVGEQISAFRRDVKHGTVVLLHGTDHFFFRDPKQQAIVIPQIEEFLAQR